MNPRPAKEAAARAFERFEIATFTFGVEGSNTRNVGVQLKDARGNNVAECVHLRAYLSDNDDGSTLTADATTSALAIGTDGVLHAIPVTGKVMDIVTKADGKFDINVIQTAAKTYYFVIMKPDGGLIVSSALAFV